jgi:glucose/arabinose dehydrogenase
LLAIFVQGRQNKPASQTITPAAQTAEPIVQLALVATGLPSPTAIVSTGQANDERLFVLDRSGIIRIVDEQGKVADKSFLDIHEHVLGEGEMGLLGLAFAPDYAQSGFFFVNYIDKSMNTIIARYKVTGNAAIADPASSQPVLSLKQPYPNHNGGALVFGPDSYLYVALGDGGSAGDPQNRAQDLNTMFGKILRLDVHQLPYSIPATNPFKEQRGKLPEIWAYGLRNPWRISFDRSSKELYLADVGQSAAEEIDIEPAGSKGGLNYGWRCYEGDTSYNITMGCQAAETYIKPALVYDHNEGRCSLTGGYVYRGSTYPKLSGRYFYADFCSGDVFGTTKKGGKLQGSVVAKTPYQISTFGENSQGELFLADFATGSIYALQAR